MTELREAVDDLVEIATQAGLPGDRARDEGLVFAAALAESAPGAAAEWAAALDRQPDGLAAVNTAFFDAASRGRKWRQAPTTVLAELVATAPQWAGRYATALTQVASAACSLGEPTMRVTGNAAVAAAAQLGALPRQPSPAPTTSGPAPPPAGPPAPDGSRTAGDPSVAAAAPAAEAELPPPRPVAELLAELDDLIGLERVKREVHQQVALLTMEQKRAAAGLRAPELTRHLVFVGNPGTGKTTVARMVGEIYRSLGLLAKGQLVEVDRSELVAGYLGQTAIKTAETIATAVGGVLFIDEAYALTGDQYGQESVNTLVKEMEDHREELVVIVAGYPDPMVAFIAANPGLSSRFKTVIEFEDYTDEEIVQILHALAARAEYDVTPGAEEVFRTALAAAARTPAFGNGRYARNRLEEAIGRHAWRLRDAADPAPDELRQLLAEDFAAERPTDASPGGDP